MSITRVISLHLVLTSLLCGIVSGQESRLLNSRSLLAQAPVVEPPKEQDRPSIFDGLRRIIGDSPAFDDNDATEGLVESLNHAEKAFKEIRQSNREAIRGMNRQIRIGRAKQSPNIILITVPQLRFDHLPAMNRLGGVRTSGLTFTNYYAPADTLAHARWSLHTGQLAASASEDRKVARPESLAEVMWKAGYETTMIGTWANSQHPIELGYDHWTGFPASQGVVDKYPEFFFTQSTKAKFVGGENSDQPHSLQLISDEVTTFLGQHQQPSRQFYLHVGLPFIQGNSIDVNMHQVDQVLGEIIDAVNSLGLAGKVCLMITGETSHRVEAEVQQELPVVGQKLSYSKSGLNEGNLRTPFIVFWGNNTSRGTISQFPCSALDLKPTMLALAHAQQTPSGMPGVSLIEEFLGKPTQTERLLYFRMKDGGQAARRGRWKVILPAGNQAIELYDLERDPTESSNVAKDHPEIVKSFIVNSNAKKSIETETL